MIFAGLGPPRTHLVDLARTASGPRPQSRTKSAPRVSARLTQLLDAMVDVPALIMGPLGDSVGSNRLGRALFPHLFPMGEALLNHARNLFLDLRAQEFYPDWGKSALEQASALRLRLGNDPSDRALMSLVGELSTLSPRFRALWGGRTAISPQRPSDLKRSGCASG